MVDIIIKEYIKNKKSILQLSKDYNCSPSTINRLLKENNVQIRNSHNQ